MGREALKTILCTLAIALSFGIGWSVIVMGIALHTP